MNFNIRSICNKYQEMTVDEISTGTMDNAEAKALAIAMLNAADELLCGIDEDASNACTRIIERLSQ